MRTIEFSLSAKSINQAIKDLKAWDKWVEKKSKRLLEELADRGIEVMSHNFYQAVYDGTNDVKCQVKEKGDHYTTLIATGNAVLFIEFGTGVKYPDNHPEKPEGLVGRGEYGKGKGKNPEGWRYVGEPGTNGVRSKTAKKKSVIHTYGNPANQCVYQTIQQLKDEFEEIARRVFND